MGVSYLWDTNTVIYYLQQQFPPNAEKFIDDILQSNQTCIYAITEIELLCWKSLNQKDEKVLGESIEDALVLELERPIKLKTAAIRKQHKIKLPDAIIAATAEEYGLTLLTRNVKDFQTIPEMKLIDRSVYSMNP